jgi:hypothetical protein
VLNVVAEVQVRDSQYGWETTSKKKKKTNQDKEEETKEREEEIEEETVDKEEGKTEEEIRLAKIVNASLDSMYDFIGIKLYSSIPKVPGKKKILTLNPNMTLFTLYGIESLNKHLQVIQPTPKYRSHSSVHVWESKFFEDYQSLMREWGVEPIPTFKKIVSKTSEKEQFSFLWIDNTHPFEVSFSKNTGLLTFKFNYQIMNSQGFSWNTQLE